MMPDAHAWSGSPRASAEYVVTTPRRTTVTRASIHAPTPAARKLPVSYRQPPDSVAVKWHDPVWCGTTSAPRTEHDVASGYSGAWTGAAEEVVVDAGPDVTGAGPGGVTGASRGIGDPRPIAGSDRDRPATEAACVGTRPEAVPPAAASTV